MKKKFKTIGIGKKVIPTAAALGILFSMAPIAENKASAGIGGVVIDVGITSLGIVKDIYEALGISVEDGPNPNDTTPYSENISYRAPSFKSGEFNISMHHTKDDTNFTKTIKVLYPNGKSEIHKLKSGQQLNITEAGTIVDLNPDAGSVSEHDLLYITQAQLDEGKTGIALNQAKTIYVEKTSGKNSRLVNELHKKNHKQTTQWEFARGTDALFAELSDEEKRISTLTSKPVSKDVLWNYLISDSKALADFHDRSSAILADSTKILETPIALTFSVLNDGKPYQIIPYKKGTNKVLVKTGSKYLSGKEGNALQYSDSIGDDEVFELVQTGNSSDNKSQFHLKNKNGVSLAGNSNIQQFGTDSSFNSEIRFTAKSNNEIHNWLKEWYPGKENERQKHDEIELLPDEKDPTKWIARDSSRNVIKNSWVKLIDNYFYAGSDGFLLKGWQEIEGNTYYFDPSNCELFTAKYKSHLRIEGKLYNFNDSGALQRSTWSKSGHNGRAYSDASGAFIEKGLREIDGEIYYFVSYAVDTSEIRLEDQDIILHFSDKGALERASKLNGEALDSLQTQVIFEEKTLMFEKDGSIRKSGISKIFLPGLFGEKDQPVLKYYSLEEGGYYTGWKEVDGKKYYFKNGQNYTFDGHETIDGKRYYFNHDGEAKLTGLDKVDGKIYYYNDKGEMQKGWQDIDGKRYYFQDSGEAAIGKFHVWGYFFPDFGYFNYYAKKDGSIYQNVNVHLPVKDDYYREFKFDNNGHYKGVGETLERSHWQIKGVTVVD
ncbi:cell wall-binding protein [Bacillus sp. DHT2]|uniref:cell wall-binding protein n=1 Tax=Bacillus sp. DHT2 TaxID=2994532 RepID=UPI002248F6A8|nr:cell wall-binding protein [Bacillus sp. DHT2]MCX2829169.1 cell wall-binding protein [Bacillus sp. DHT2]